MNALHTITRSKPSERRWLSRTPNWVVVGVVVLADVAFNGSLSLSRNSPVDLPGEPAGRLACERGSCERQPTATPAGSVSVPTGKPRLLEFTSAHCSTCSKMAPLVRKLETECTARDGTILLVDVDSDAGDVLATRYGVNALPTFVMVDSNGQEVRRLVGEQPRERLSVALADVNGVFCTVL